MNYLVFLDPRTEELEKILSGLKSMLVKEINPAGSPADPIEPDDSLYFLRNSDECALCGMATVVGVQFFTDSMNEDLSQNLKELQPRLQLTKDQYNYWSNKEQVMLIEFDRAQKTEVIHVASNKIMDRLDWIAFKDFSEIT